MKKTTRIFKSFIAITAITILVACKKDIEQPVNDLNANSKVIPAIQVVNPLAFARKNPNGYTGTSTLGDSTKAGN